MSRKNPWLDDEINQSNSSSNPTSFDPNRDYSEARESDVHSKTALYHTGCCLHTYIKKENDILKESLNKSRSDNEKLRSHCGELLSCVRLVLDKSSSRPAIDWQKRFDELASELKRSCIQSEYNRPRSSSSPVHTISFRMTVPLGKSKIELVWIKMAKVVVF